MLIEKEKQKLREKIWKIKEKQKLREKIWKILEKKSKF